MRLEERANVKRAAPHAKLRMRKRLRMRDDPGERATLNSW